MGKRGPKPKPTSMIVTPWRAAARDGEPKPPLVAPPEPDDLDEAGRRLWRDTAQKLFRAGLLSELDAQAFETLVRCQLEDRMLTQQINKIGLLVKGSKGSIMRNPLLSVRDKVRERLDRMLGEFGMTPSARTKVRSEAPAMETQVDPVDELLNE